MTRGDDVQPRRLPIDMDYVQEVLLHLLRTPSPTGRTDEVVQYVHPDECQISYNPLQMALTWEALATRKATLLDDALAWLECTTHAVHDGGDHSVIMGAVTGAAVRDGVDDPLLYYRSHYGTIVRSTLSEKTIQEKA